MPPKTWDNEDANARDRRRLRLGCNRAAEVGGASLDAQEDELIRTALFSEAEIRKFAPAGKGHAANWNEYYAIRNEAIAEHRKLFGTNPPAAPDGVRAATFYAQNAVLAVTEAVGSLPLLNSETDEPTVQDPTSTGLSIQEALTRLRLIKVRAEQIADDQAATAAQHARRLAERNAKRSSRAAKGHVSPPHKKGGNKRKRRPAKGDGSATESEGKQSDEEEEEESDSEEEKQRKKKRSLAAKRLKLGAAAALLRR
jgi:hypothetical protein